MKQLFFLLSISSFLSWNVNAQTTYVNGMSHKHQNVLQINNGNGNIGFITSSSCDGNKVCLSKKDVNGVTLWDKAYTILEGATPSTEVNALSICSAFRYQQPQYNFVVTGSYRSVSGQDKMFIMLIDDNGNLLRKNALIENPGNTSFDHLYGTHVFQNSDGGYIVSGNISSGNNSDMTDSREILVAQFDFDLNLQWCHSYNSNISGQTTVSWSSNYVDYDMATKGVRFAPFQYLITGSRQVDATYPGNPQITDVGVLNLLLDDNGDPIMDNSFNLRYQFLQSGADILIDDDRYYILSNKFYEHTFSITAFDRATHAMLPNYSYDAVTSTLPGVNSECSNGYIFGNKLFRDMGDGGDEELIITGYHLGDYTDPMVIYPDVIFPFVMKLKEEDPWIDKSVNLTRFEPSAMDKANLGTGFFAPIQPNHPFYDPANYFMSNTVVGASEHRFLSLVPMYDGSSRVDNKIIAFDYHGEGYKCSTSCGSLQFTQEDKKLDGNPLIKTDDVAIEVNVDIQIDLLSTQEFSCAPLFNGRTHEVDPGGGGGGDNGVLTPFRKKTNQQHIGMQEPDNPNWVEITVWPNPAKNQIQISGLLNGAGSIEVIDLTGKVVKEEWGELSIEHIVNISELNAGTYIVKVKQGERSKNIRLIKE